MTRRRVLVVSGRPPWPPWRGDRLRTRQWVEALVDEYDVTVLTPESPTAPDYTTWPGVRHRVFRTSAPPIRALHALRAWAQGLPAQCGMYAYPKLTRELRRAVTDHDVTVLLLARLALHVPALEGTRWIADLIDALSLSFDRRARFDHPVLSPLLKLEARRLARAEGRMIDRATRTVVVGRRDARYLGERFPGSEPRISVVPVAPPVDPPGRARGTPGRTSGAVVAFTGNLGYFVNRDALEWWLDWVWPDLRQRRPELRLLVAGDRPSRDLVRRVNDSGGQLVPRPDDLRALLASATIAVAPLRAGAGMPLKVIDAWTVGVPVVASAWAAAGVDAEDGLELRVADHPREWIETIESLLDDPEQRQRLAQEGRRALDRRFGRETVFRELRGVVAQAVGGDPGASVAR